MSDETLTVFQNLERTGDDGAILRAAGAAQADGRLTPWQALAAGRAGLRSARYIDAAQWLAVAGDSDDPGLRRLAMLEQAHLAIAARLDLAPAKAIAAETGSSVPAEARPELRAECAWVGNRLIAALSVYREVPPERAQQALDACLQAADSLDALGLPRRALAVRRHVADQQPPDRKLDALQDVARRAEAAGEPDFVARCHAASALLCLVLGQMADADAFVAQAGAAYRRSGDVLGDLRTEALRQTVNVIGRALPFAPLEDCVRQFAGKTVYSEAITALLTLSDRSLWRGDSVLSRQYSDWLLRIAEPAGAPSLAVHDLMAKVDAATRAGLYRDAISFADSLLLRDPPAMFKAGALVQRSVAMTRLGRPQAALADIAAACRHYALVHAEADESDTVAHHVGLLDGASSDAAFTAADRLLLDWQARDMARADRLRAVDKIVARVDLRATRAVALRNAGQDAEALLDEVPGLLDEAALALDAEPAEAVRVKAFRASLAQHRGQFAAFRNDTAQLIDATNQAAALYGDIGYGMQQANCLYILGCIFFNQFNAATDAKAFGNAERNLQDALRYYREKGGLQVQAAQTAEKLVRLYLTASRYLPGEHRIAILAAAETLIREALASLDEIRRAYFANDRLDARTGKAVHGPESQALHGHAVRLAFLLAPDFPKALHFVSQQKSRILADLMGADLAIPAALQATLQADPRLAALMQQERAAVAGFADANGDDIAATRTRLAGLYDAMAQSDAARPYVEVRRGEAPDAADLPAILEVPGARAVFVDWVDVAGQVWVLASGSSGQVAAAPTGMPIKDVQAFRETALSTLSFRTTLDRTPELLARMDALAAPLAGLSAPGDHLVLCPTGAVGAIPLHALSVGGVALLERNPVFYAPSLGILRTCRLFDRPDAPRRAALFGVLDDMHEASRAMIGRLAAAIGATAVIGPDVTGQGVLDALATATLVHFQGHGRHDADDPLQSHLVLPAGARLTAERIFTQPAVTAQLVVLGACEGAISRADAGDELLGLIPAFLAAGVGAVVAAGWRVKETTASRFMDAFYDSLRGGAWPILAAQQAALAVKRVTDAPYHWAAFVGYGNPWGRIG